MLMWRVVLGRFVGVLLLGMVGLSCPDDGSRSGVFHCYLTWQGDTGTTMTVNYHSAEAGPSHVFFDTESQDGDPAAYRFVAEGTSHHVPFLRLFEDADRPVHTVELTGLSPGETYFFVAGDEATGFSTEKKFRTISDNGALRIVSGGDIGTGSAVSGLFRHAAAQDPHVALVGGDIAYADGRLKEWDEWDEWLDLWERHMVTPDGYEVPMILAAGNHEVDSSFFAFATPLFSAPFYFGYLAQDGSGIEPGRRAYFSRWLGNNLRLFVLDSAHVTPLTGHQLDWLRAELAATPDDVLTVALYHVPLYPSHRNFGPLSISALVRTAWRRTFDEFGLDLGFENHDHMHKRTHPLRNNRIDPEGTVYLGDGCFGRSPRDGDQARRLEDPAELARLGLEENYLAAWASRRHFWSLEYDPVTGALTAMAIDETGTIFDSTQLTAKGAGNRQKHAQVPAR